MKKITPRDIINALGTMLRNHKAGKKVPVGDIVLWVTRAKILISKQAAEIEDLKAQLRLLAPELAQQVSDIEKTLDQEPPAEVKDNDC